MADSNHLRAEALDRIATGVRDRFRAAWPAGALVSLGNGGGFSGARLWRYEGIAGRLCLRAWPAHKSAAWVRRLHQLMQCAHEQGLAFVPAVLATRDGDTVVEAAGRTWELTQWLEGRADFADHRSPARLEAACEALAQLHRTWEAFAGPAAVCPAVQNRRNVLADWQALAATGWRPDTAPHPLLRSVSERAWRQLPDRLQAVSRSLEAWLDFRCAVQPCLRDVWHDHLLFVGEHLTGLVDYGAVREDHVATDLARLLGSLVGDDGEGWQQGLRAYRRVRALSEREEQLAFVLDRSGTVLGLANWLRWLYHENRPYDDLLAVARRMETLLRRIESWATD